MKNILLLTNIYPADDLPKGYTPVVHYFAREWVKSGYNVRVIDFDINFPQFIYWLSRPFNKTIASKAGSVLKTSSVKDKNYILEDVKVQRISVKKILPHTNCTISEIDKAYDKSILYCKDEHFIPDIIISHWANPCLMIMDRLKQQFNVPTCYVCHLHNAIDVYKDTKYKLLDNIDILGFRSEYIKRNFQDRYNCKKVSFQCYSGIPESFVDPNRKRVFNKIQNFIYVGTLIQRKYPSSILPALKKSFGDEPFQMNYIGEGGESKTIIKTAKKLNIEENVILHGRLPRERVVEMLDKNDVFVMISSNETYGLVYLEAMARGCITIASKREGFDGIIQDGVNGFLCEAGDSKELAGIIKRIRNMSKAELSLISDNAIATSCELTDVKAAKKYIESIESILSIK